ncbi:MAG: prepilin-type N-terminal cleavage/methylation domain-containing protein [Candidatus Xenobiia bacterium LiM19]
MTRFASKTKTLSEKGFSLIEVMIAIVLFAAGVIAVMYLFPLGVKEVSFTKELTAATFLAQAKLEEKLLLPAAVDSDETGNFGPEYPQLTYTITRRRYMNKTQMIHIAIEVYKAVPGGGTRTIIHYDALKGVGGNVENNF